MNSKTKRQFLTSIVAPSILVLILFVGAVLAYLIPSIEQNMMDGKKEMIKELTHSAWSLIEEYDKEYKAGKISLNEAQQLAAHKVSHLRFGAENKDYFWIVDMTPSMIIHPYRNELRDSDLSLYEDPNGVKLFVESVELVERQQEGFIDYMWQWKDDTSRIVPKLSFVKAYPDWQWIIGTGIYLDDVQAEIQSYRKKLINISLLIFCLLTILIFFLVRNSFKIENAKLDAQMKLHWSREKYKSLVEASTEGTLMILDDKIIFANQKISQLTKLTMEEITEEGIERLFSINWNECKSAFDSHINSITKESKIINPDKSIVDVVLSISKVKHNTSDGYIIVAKEVSRQRIIKKEMIHLSEELESNLHLINQSIKPFLKEIYTIDLNASASSIVELMTRKKCKAVFVQQQEQIIGMITEHDLAFKKNPKEEPLAMHLMNAPINSIRIDAAIYEAQIRFDQTKESHLAVHNSNEETIGYINKEDVLSFQQNNVNYILKEIDLCEGADELKALYQRSPVLLNALIQSGDKSQNIALLISKITDAISKRVIDLAIEKHGVPPCEFSFLALGSEGRKEQTLSTDQDNAIIYDDKGPAEASKEYFVKLAQTINQNLAKIGYRLCEGNHMASNPNWCLSLQEWKAQFKKWVHESDPQSIMEAAIFFDFREIYGNSVWVKDLRDYIDKQIATKQVFFYQMANANLKFKTSTISSEGQFNIKQVMQPMIGFMRLYAFKERIHHNNTTDRLAGLESKGIISNANYREWYQSYNFLMAIRLHHQSNQIINNEKADNLISIDHLTELDKATLKRVINEIKNMQSKIANDFNIS
jgi:signal-transduction protein with cAMP-binding, CBS, and nucleotidyltransferase domain